jgi:hypothetical protein
MESQRLVHLIAEPEEPMRIFVTLSLLVVISIYCTAQPDSASVTIQKTNANYTQILYHENRIYGITSYGQAVIWDLSSFDTVAFNHNDTVSYKFLCVAKDRLNQLYFGTNTGHVFQYKPETGEWLLYKKIRYRVHHLFFNSENQPIFIIANAVYDPIRKKYWDKFENRDGGFVVTKKVLWLFKKRVYHYFNMPDYTFLDSHDRLWMTASFGEFGGSVQIFDTKNYRIVEPKLDSINMGLLFPRSVFEGSSNEILITSGLQHFSNSGDIYRINSDNSTTLLFHSSGHRKIDSKTRKVVDEGGLFIGPGAYNPSDGRIYFATSRGIHKMHIDKNDVKIELVINPDLSWEREPMAIGVAMNIKKMEFLPDGSLMFLTTKDGIGILRNNAVSFLK